MLLDGAIHAPQQANGTRVISFKVRRMKSQNCKKGMPGRRERNDDGFIVVIELIGGDVHYQSITLKPGVRLVTTLTKYILKVVIAILLQIFGQQERRITTSAQGVVLQSFGEVYRIALLNRPAKSARQTVTVVYLSLRPDGLHINQEYPFPISP